MRMGCGMGRTFTSSPPCWDISPSVQQLWLLAMNTETPQTTPVLCSRTCQHSAAKTISLDPFLMPGALCQLQHSSITPAFPLTGIKSLQMSCRRDSAGSAVTICTNKGEAFPPPLSHLNYSHLEFPLLTMQTQRNPEMWQCQTQDAQSTWDHNPCGHPMLTFHPSTGPTGDDDQPQSNS